MSFLRNLRISRLAQRPYAARTVSARCMQTAHIGNEGTKLAYIDSGAPPGDSYTTLVCIHGHTYHAQNFQRLLPLAHQHNLRIIALNRRDYVGSTPFTQSELNAINGNDASEHKKFLQARGLEYAQFLEWVVKEKNIPRASADGKSGGMALMGWSLGNVMTLAFLRHLSTYPSETLRSIEPYLKTFFFYEVAYSGLGYPRPEGFYQPLTDPTIPADQLGAAFNRWVSSYYKHPALASGSREMSALQVRAPTNPYRRPSLEAWTPEDFANCADLAPGKRSELPYWSIVRPETVYDLTEGSLVLRNKTSAAERQGLLPDLKIRVVYGVNSLWSIYWGAWELEKDMKKWEAEGKAFRPIQFIPVEGANHFLHWDDADLFLRKFADGIRS